MTLEHREGEFFRVIGQKEPVAGQARVVHRRVAPGVSRLGAGGATGFEVGAVSIWQAIGLRVALAGADHAVEGGQEFGFLDHPAGAAQDGLWIELAQAFQPEFFDLVEHFNLVVGLVVLVVVIDAKQGEDLIDRIDVACLGARSSLSRVSWPSCGR